MKTLIDLFLKSLLQAKTDKICLKIIRKTRQEILTFGELKEKALKFAFYLIQQKKIKPGDKIAILGKNQADWDTVFWGVVLAGGIPVLIDPERRVEGAKNHIFHTDAKFIIMADDYQEEKSRQGLKDLADSQGLDLIEMPIPPDEIIYFARDLLTKIQNKIQPDDTAVIVCTSGTTKDPREVELTHRNIITNLQGSLEIVKITSEDRVGHIIPFHHSFGLTVAKLLPLLVGATSIYTDKYSQVLQIIKEEEITIFLGVPALFIIAAKRIEKKIRKNRLLRTVDSYFPSLIGKRIVGKKFRFFVSGSAALPKWVSETFWKRGVELRQGYGTTENSPVYGFNTNPKKLESVGKPIPDLFVKIVDGEILLGGPCIMKGYYKNPEATESVIEIDKDGIRWVHTGDLGYLDEDGDLFITGRKKYLIVLPNGKNVNPELVECALSEAKYVKEILIVPHYVGNKEETIKAIVRPSLEEIEPNTGPQALKNIVWQSINEYQQKTLGLASFEKIQSKELLEIKLDDFEKTSTGKIKREAYIR